MKRIYIKPETAVCATIIDSIMQSVSGRGMNYGGVDVNGTMSMDSKERDWEEI